MKPTAPQGRLVKEWQGHTVEVGERGLAIDGRTVDPTPLAAEDAVRPSDDVRTHPALQFLPGGSLVYRGHVQAEIRPDTVTLHGPEGVAWPPEPDRPDPGPIGPEPEPDDDLDIDF